MIRFIDREKEMGKLLEIAESKKAELVLLYGRRRVGKSTILTEFSKKTGALYLLADVSKTILNILAKQTAEEFVRFSTWEDFFEFLYKSKHKIIIIDEFQYLYHVNKAWPSMMQRWWEKLKDTDKKIILSGSMISTIYRIAKGYGSALYGRKTVEIEIFPLRFGQITEFLPEYSIEDDIRAYALAGGVPRYLEEFDSKLSIEENIKRKILDKTSFLYNEPMNLLFEEFRDPAPYVAILSAVAYGNTKFAEISQACGIGSHKLPKYLIVLERVKIIEKDIPITERKAKSKITRYRIKDNFYRFWFTYVFTNKSMIELGLEKEVFEKIMTDFNAYVGKCFEDICMEMLVSSRRFPLTKIGRWWHKDKEIDIVGLNDETKEILFAECKWQENVDALKVIKELKEKAVHVEWNNGTRREYYAVFAKSFKERISEEGVVLFDLKEMEMR